MAVSEGVIEQARELLADFGAIEARRMFGGAGIYREGLMFALVIGHELYFKADEVNRPGFEAAGSEPFAYGTRDGRTNLTSYWKLPASAADDAAECCRWARLGFEAALRAKRPKGAWSHTSDLGPGPWDP